MASPAGPDEPFRPRPRWSVLLRQARRPTPMPAFLGLPTLAAFAFTLFCFVQVFRGIGGAAGGNVVGAGGSATMWMVLAAGSAGLLGLAMNMGAPDRKATLKPGALREMARWAWAAARARLPRRGR